MFSKKTERIVFIPDSQVRLYIFYELSQYYVHQRIRFRESNQQMGKLYCTTFMSVCLLLKHRKTTVDSLGQLS